MFGLTPGDKKAKLVGVIVGAVDALGMPSRVCVDGGYAVAVRADSFIVDSVDVRARFGFLEFCILCIQKNFKIYW